jgi:hypothetical protein
MTMWHGEYMRLRCRGLGLSRLDRDAVLLLAARARPDGLVPLSVSALAVELEATRPKVSRSLAKGCELGLYALATGAASRGRLPTLYRLLPDADARAFVEAHRDGLRAERYGATVPNGHGSTATVPNGHGSTVPNGHGSTATVPNGHANRSQRARQPFPVGTVIESKNLESLNHERASARGPERKPLPIGPGAGVAITPDDAAAFVRQLDGEGERKATTRKGAPPRVVVPMAAAALDALAATPRRTLAPARHEARQEGEAKSRPARQAPDWAQRIAGYDPARSRLTWPSTWGPPPDSDMTNPHAPELQARWQAQHPEAMQRKPGRVRALADLARSAAVNLASIRARGRA